MEIDVIDARDPDRGRLRRRWLAHLRAASHRVELGEGSEFEAELVRRVCHLAQQERVRVLRIWTDQPPSFSLISPEHDELEAPDLARGIVTLSRKVGLLHSVFGAGAHAELRGCDFGLRAPGRQYVQALARVWHVPIQAGAVLQTTGEWRDPVIQAMPTGAVMLTGGMRIWRSDQQVS